MIYSFNIPELLVGFTFPSLHACSICILTLVKVKLWADF